VYLTVWIKYSMYFQHLEKPIEDSLIIHINHAVEPISLDVQYKIFDSKTDLCTAG
jgi:hypothetical protein